jgi:hypothetical protein
MTNWLIIQDNVVVNAIVADSKEYVEENFDGTIIEDNGTIGVGWTDIDGLWKSPYPTNGLEYIWNEEFRVWDVVHSPEEDVPVEEV